MGSYMSCFYGERETEFQNCNLKFEVKRKAKHLSDHFFISRFGDIRRVVCKKKIKIKIKGNKVVT